MADKKVLVVSDYKGRLHITPFNNKAYYLGRNHANKARSDRQFKIQEMDASEAEKYVHQNKGIDPKYVSPKDVQNELSLKDNKIAELERKLAEMQNPTVPQVVEQVKHAQTAEEAKQISAQYDEKEIEKATQKKLDELAKEANTKSKK